MTDDPRIAHSPRWSNCIFWVLHQLRAHGGYGLIRHGYHGFYFHVLWVPPGSFVAGGLPAKVYSYEPLRTKAWYQLWKWRFDNLFVLYRGHVVEGDELPVILV
jgi:hypothetical protein